MLDGDKNQTDDIRKDNKKEGEKNIDIPTANSYFHTIAIVRMH